MKKMKTIKVQVDDFMPSKFPITYLEETRLGRNSIERVINTAISILEESDSNVNRFDPETCVDDLKELKELMVRLWYSGQQAVFAANADMKEEMN